MRYIKSRYEIDSRDWIYRFYIAEAVKIAANNTANWAGGSIITKHLNELFSYQSDIRTSEDIISDIRDKLGGA